MARARPTIGAGLADLVTGAVQEGKTPDVVQRLPISRLRPNPNQPRRHFDQVKLEELAASVREQGVLQPLLARNTLAGLELVAGERRLRAAKLAGLAEVPVVVRDLPDDQAALLAAVENLQRENLGVLDEVDATVTIVGQRLGIGREEVPGILHALTRDPAANEKQVRELTWLFGQLGGTWQSFTKNKLRILRWPAEVLGAMREHGLAYTLAGVVAAAPQAQRERLLELALSGATHAELRAAVEAPLRKGGNENPLPARRVAQILSSKKRLEALDERREKRLRKLLAEIEALFNAPESS